VFGQVVHEWVVSLSILEIGYYLLFFIIQQNCGALATIVCKSFSRLCALKKMQNIWDVLNWIFFCCLLNFVEWESC